MSVSDKANIKNNTSIAVSGDTYIVDSIFRNNTSLNTGGIIKLSNSSFSDITSAYAAKGYSIADSTVSNSALVGGYANISNSAITDTSITAREGISAYNASTLNNVNILNSTSVVLTDVNVKNSSITATHIKTDNATLEDVTLLARYNANILNSNLINSLNINTINGYINLEDNNGGSLINLNAATKVLITNSELGNSRITTNTENVDIINSTLTSATIDSADNITLKGITVNGDLTVTSGKDVLLSNSDGTVDETQSTINELASGKTAINDYNTSNITTTELENLYETGDKISYINGNVKISGVDNVSIIKTAITGNLEESDISGTASLLGSYVGGNYIPDSTSVTDTIVYNSYIDGTYEIKYPVKIDDNNGNGNGNGNGNSNSNSNSGNNLLDYLMSLLENFGISSSLFDLLALFN